MTIENCIKFVFFESLTWKYEFTALMVIVIVIFYLKHKLSFWSRQQIPYEIMIFNNWSLNSINESDYQNSIKLGKVFGTYKFLTPVLCVSDINLIEKILVKNFHNFFEQRTWFLESQILVQSLFGAKYSQWKRQKQIISAAFNSRKLKSLQPIVQKSSIGLVKCLNSICDLDLPINVFEYFGCYALYSMLSVVFDIDVEDQFNNINHPLIMSYNKFSTKKAILSQSICSLHPFMAKGSNLYFLNGESIRHLKSILDNAIQMRTTKDSNYFKNFIDILTKSDADDEVISSNLSHQELKDNLIAVFIAATEAIGKTISYCIYHLSTNPDLQALVYNEIADKIKCIDNINWDTLRQLTYTEAFIKETLRYSTPFGRYERVVKKDLRLNTKMYGNILLPKNAIVSVLASVVHMDKDYFADPHRFNPNRFLPEYKHLITPKAFIPFAIGYRHCIGMKYAFYHIKHCLAHLLLNFKFEIYSNSDLENCDFKKRDEHNLTADKLLVKIAKI